jgi:hypothetical protein
MPRNSLADVVTDWEKLLKNVADTATELPSMEPYKGPLEQLLNQAKDGLALSQARRGLKQQETKDLQLLMGTGKNAAAKLRSAIKAHFGPTSERLIQYGMKPARKRKRSDSKNKKPKTVDPTSASPSEPTPQES